MPHFVNDGLTVHHRRILGSNSSLRRDTPSDCCPTDSNPSTSGSGSGGVVGGVSSGTVSATTTVSGLRDVCVVRSTGTVCRLDSDGDRVVARSAPGTAALVATTSKGHDVLATSSCMSAAQIVLKEFSLQRPNHESQIKVIDMNPHHQHPPHHHQHQNQNQNQHHHNQQLPASSTVTSEMTQVSFLDDDDSGDLRWGKKMNSQDMFKHTRFFKNGHVIRDRILLNMSYIAPANSYILVHIYSYLFS